MTQPPNDASSDAQPGGPNVEPDAEMDAETGAEPDVGAGLADRFGARAEDLVRLQSAALEAAANGVIITDAAGVIVWANPAAERMTGYARSELIGQNPRILKSGEQPASYYRDLWRAIAAGHVWRGDLRNRRKDGSLYTEEMTIAPVLDAQGTPTHFVAIKQDVTEARRLNEDLARSEAWWKALLENGSDLVGVDDADGRFRYLSPSVKRILGYEPEELIGTVGFDLVHPEDAERIRSSFREKTTHTRRNEPVTMRFRHKDGSWRVMEAVSTNALDDPAVRGVIVNARDVTERREREAQLVRFRAFRTTLAEIAERATSAPADTALLQEILDYAVHGVPGASAGSVLLMAPDGGARFVAVHGYASQLLGVSLPAEVIEDDATREAPWIRRRFVPSPALDARTRSLLYGASDERPRIRASLKVPIWIEGRARAQFNLDNFEASDAFSDEAMEMARLFGRQVATILQRMDLEEIAAERATTDPLTGLPNRTRGEALLVAALDRRGARESGERGERGAIGALCLLDVDDFKLINDAHGYAVGDEAVRQIAARLERAVGDTCTLVRWAGDEFVILCGRGDEERGGGGERDIEAYAEAILDVFGAPFHIGDVILRLDASMGIVVIPRDAETAGDALRNAHIALHRAKREGKNTFAAYAPEFRDAIVRRMRVEQALRHAIESGKIHLHYQPRVDLRTERSTSVEALARWTDEELGPVSPGEFIPVAEETGLIHEFGLLVLDRACRQAKRWLDAGAPRRVAVNLSLEQLRRPALVDEVARTLERHALRGEWLELEITESAAMDDVDYTIRTLSAFRRLGVSLAIDDFGTAYSSLAHLKLMPIDALKIDRDFVKDLPEDPSRSPVDASIVQSIVALGRSMNLKVIAEGVETEAQKRFLAFLGCDEAQGYLLGRPVPAEELPD